MGGFSHGSCHRTDGVSDFSVTGVAIGQVRGPSIGLDSVGVGNVEAKGLGRRKLMSCETTLSNTSIARVGWHSRWLALWRISTSLGKTATCARGNPDSFAAIATVVVVGLTRSQRAQPADGTGIDCS